MDEFTDRLAPQRSYAEDLQRQVDAEIRQRADACLALERARAAARQAAESARTLAVDIARREASIRSLCSDLAKVRNELGAAEREAYDRFTARLYAGFAR